jgi:hypothetical protein
MQTFTADGDNLTDRFPPAIASEAGPDLEESLAIPHDEAIQEVQL